MNETGWMKGKICLVTGATDGIGRETALGLARCGARVVIVGRNPAKAAAAARDIAQQSGNDAIEILLADLSSLDEVRRLAAEFRQQHDRLDVLVNNAGGLFWTRQETVDGLELTFALNHLSYYLLTHLLLEALQASQTARIVNVSSGAHFGGKMHFDDLQLKRGYRAYTAYGQSKLANVLFTYELARRLQGSRVTANVLHPGFVATRFGLNNGKIISPMIRLTQLLAISPEQGAQTSIYLATSPEVEGVSGKYFDRKRAVASSAVSYNEEDARRLWQISADLTGSGL